MAPQAAGAAWGGNHDGYFALRTDRSEFVVHVLEDGPSGVRVIAHSFTEFAAFVIREVFLAHPSSDVRALAAWVSFPYFEELCAFIAEGSQDWEDPLDYRQDRLLQFVRGLMQNE